jgi:hypothetical protein
MDGLRERNKSSARIAGVVEQDRNKRHVDQKI